MPNRRLNLYIIAGCNGAGKTTLVKMLMGFAWPVYGARVEILGNRMCGVSIGIGIRLAGWRQLLSALGA